MRNLKSLLILTLVLMRVIPASSQIQVSGSTVTHYVWRGFDVLAGCPAFQPSITYTCPKTAISANIWTSWSMTRREHGSIRDLDEIDMTLSYDYNLEKIGMSGGVIHYNFPNMDNWPDKYSTDPEIFLGITMETLLFSPKLTAFYALNEDTWEGMYILASVSHSLETDAVPLDISFSVGYSDQSLLTNITDSGISDVNLSVETVIKSCLFNCIPTFTLTYVPDDLIYPDGLIFWGGLKFEKSITW